MLKRLSEAVRDNDPICGVIRGWGMNHNGKTNGITSPCVTAQVALGKDVLERFKIDPKTISLVEGHGTGTKLGDSIEAEALTEMFQLYTQKNNYCALGTVKSNIGHLLAASGVSSVIKTLLSLQRKMLPPTINFNKLNDYIKLDNSPFYINTELKPWDVEHGSQRRASVNSFGFSGTNAHVVVEEYEPNLNDSPIIMNSKNPILFVLSAKSAEQLKIYATSMKNYIEKHSELNLVNMAYTLQVGRDEMDYRLAFVSDTKENLIEKLVGFINETVSPEILSEKVKKGKFGKRNIDKDAKKLLGNYIREKKLIKIADLWVKGLALDWNKLYIDVTPNRISIPGYPFAREHYWAINDKTESKKITEEEVVTDDSVSLESLQEYLVTSLAKYLLIDQDEIDVDSKFVEMGIDSSFVISWIQKINYNYGINISVSKLFDYPTINDFSHFLFEKEMIKNQNQIEDKSNYAKLGLRFPELIKLNQSTDGRPVFWFHGGIGGVVVYQEIAQKSSRPFYGIQARGWMTDRLPLNGVQAMAAYYIHIIQSVQPDGPYDFGGYSLGGTLAYETARQLQEMGEKVNSIVMLDSIDPIRMKNMATSKKTIMMQVVNLGLMSTIMDDPDKVSQTLINRDELDESLDDDTFLKGLINLSEKRGLLKSEDQIYSQIQKNSLVQEAYNLDDYYILPLSDPKALTCYYFRNKSGKFIGEYESYFLSKTDKILVDNVNYWEEWEQNISNFEIIDLNSSNHMTLLVEAKSFELIAAFCEKEYR